MSGHTAEPWVVEDLQPDWEIQGRGGKCYVATCSETNILAEANARRIVACVNACAGLPDPGQDIEDTYAEFQALRAQRDALLRAAREALATLEMVSTDLDPGEKVIPREMARILRVAIAKVEDHG